MCKIQSHVVQRSTNGKWVRKNGGLEAEGYQGASRKWKWKMSGRQEWKQKQKGEPEGFPLQCVISIVDNIFCS